MPFTLSTFTKLLKTTFTKINKDQAEALAVEIAANFIAGQHAAEKHKSFKSAEPEEDEDDLTTTEKAEIAALVALYLGYSKGFNKIAEKQISDTVKDMVTAGKPQEEIRAYVGSVFDGKEKIVIDNIGKIRKEIRVDKNLHITQVEKVVKQKYYSSLNNYADLLGDQAAHDAYESGRKTANISAGLNQWVFTGPADERARPWHVALIGTTYTYGSDQSAYAESCLSEPRCRHRAMAFYGDDRDTKKEYWDKLKKDSGLYWDDQNQKWGLNEFKSPTLTPNDLENVLIKNEKTLLGRTTEKAFVFDKNGKLLIEKEGTTDAVEFSKTELEKLKGNILTHNHPHVSPFSKADIKLACDKGLNEIRVIDPNGTYTMKLKNGGNLNTALWDEKLSISYKKQLEELSKRYYPKYANRVQQGTMTEWEANNIISTMAWHKVKVDVPEIEFTFKKLVV